MYASRSLAGDNVFQGNKHFQSQSQRRGEKQRLHPMITLRDVLGKEGRIIVKNTLSSLFLTFMNSFCSLEGKDIKALFASTQ